ncbi:energy transducer TonB [Hymenobacter sp. 5516J-16]|uniref:Energy transducer TonB n=1 Tax=Hymenobacter sublimis TaxID=2933777 RepID=A0ABY4JDX0_9BACT|nr:MULTISPECIES: energy transducer TonB [Hymenobacter]UOQ76312.1 energy transducer TonB [Hymenobacter sp. 5516J-16]UPL49982.1 energy transducer TonB [Hymenobacter sublimis]
MKHLFFLFLLVASAAGATQAQQTTSGSTITKQPIELKANRMQPQAKPAPNRPDAPPQFPGGAQGLNTFFQQNLKYPEAASVKQISGNVVMTFTVEADGHLTNPSVVQPLSPECDTEALRVLGQMPSWKPATRKGQAVPTQVRLPIPFGNSEGLKVEQGKPKFE